MALVWMADEGQLEAALARVNNSITVLKNDKMHASRHLDTLTAITGKQDLKYSDHCYTL